MNNSQNYKFYMLDDRNGNKALIAVKGHFTDAMKDLNNNGLLNDPRFYSHYRETINGIKDVLNHATVAPRKKGQRHDNTRITKANQRGTAIN